MLMLVQFCTMLSTGMLVQLLDRVFMVMDSLFAFRMNMGM